MAAGRRRKAGQAELFVATDRIRALGNPFYRALDRLLEKHGFDARSRRRHAAGSTRSGGGGRVGERFDQVWLDKAGMDGGVDHRPNVTSGSAK